MATIQYLLLMAATFQCNSCKTKFQVIRISARSDPKYCPYCGSNTIEGDNIILCQRRFIITLSNLFIRRYANCKHTYLHVAISLAFLIEIKQDPLIFFELASEAMNYSLKPLLLMWHMIYGLQTINIIIFLDFQSLSVLQQAEHLTIKDVTQSRYVCRSCFAPWTMY